MSVMLGEMYGGILTTPNEKEPWIADEIDIIYGFSCEERLKLYTGIKYLNVEGIDDSKKLSEILKTLPLETIERIEISNCDLEEMDLSIFKRLQALRRIDIIETKGIDYNEIFNQIPNKSQVEDIYLWGIEQETKGIDCDVLKKFNGLDSLGLRDVGEINKEELRQVLILNAENLSQFVIQSEIEDLKILSGLNIEHITIMDNNLDLELITPDIAREHNNLRITTELGDISINKTDKGYKLRTDVYYIIKQSNKLRDLIDNAEEVEVSNEVITINNEQELNELIENKDILEKIEEILIEVPHIGIIPHSKLEGLNIKKIIVRNLEKDKKQGNTTYLTEKDLWHTYSVEQYKVLQEKINEIIEDMPKGISDLEKFMIIYKRLGTRIVYDYQLIEEEHREEDEEGYKSEYSKENTMNARNLVNGLMKGKCVCAGYADILYNCLSAAGIECCKVGGKSKESGIGHAWNKVKIDGKWYNVDLTNDCDEILDEKLEDWECCLRSDVKFNEKYIQTGGAQIICSEDYPREKMKEAIENARMFELGVVNAEYKVIKNDTDILQQMKSFWNRITNKTKMIEAAQEDEKVLTIREKREIWTKKNNIKMDNGAEISRVTQHTIERTNRDNVDMEIDN